MNCFISPNDWEQGETVVLSPDQSHHLASVLRMSKGEQVVLLNGRGVRAVAKIADNSPRGSVLEVVSVERMERGAGIHLIFGIPKPAALEFILRRCTELGVASFHPLETDHSLRLKTWNATRWDKILGEVCKQCESPFFPELKTPVSLHDWLAKRSPDRILLFCDENDRNQTTKISMPPSDIEILIGPEGGWSDAERPILRETGTSLGLGSLRLRAEMAALVATVWAKRELGEL